MDAYTFGKSSQDFSTVNPNLGLAPSPTKPRKTPGIKPRGIPQKGWRTPGTVSGSLTEDARRLFTGSKPVRRVARSAGELEQAIARANKMMARAKKFDPAALEKRIFDRLSKERGTAQGELQDWAEKYFSKQQGKFQDWAQQQATERQGQMQDWASEMFKRRQGEFQDWLGKREEAWRKPYEARMSQAGKILNPLERLAGYAGRGMDWASNFYRPGGDWNYGRLGATAAAPVGIYALLRWLTGR